ncbi:MAG: hypothetical protein GC150_16590 [Rhizobiales bacterium]|nr:hypothetical protein [Hyphomicrobiales bacterium]
MSISTDDGFAPARKRPFDWKKALLLLGLGILSWISTYTGMLELIRANMGQVGFSVEVAIGFAVAMLMLMIIWLLDRLFDRISISVRLLYVFGYLFLTLISVGFGFGFYWKYLESRTEASRSAESAVTQVQTALQGSQTRLEQLQATLTTLTSLSATKAIAERDKGNSCPNSRPGDGPRRRLRDADAARFGFAGTFVSQRVDTVKGDIATLNADLARVIAQDPTTFDPLDGTRNAFLRELGRKLEMASARFNAFRSDPQLLQFRADFNERAGKTVFDDEKGGTFACPDPELQAALRGVVRAIDQLPELEKPKVSAVEGSEAIVEAFRRLTVTLYGAFQLKLPPTPDELRELQQKAVATLQDNVAQRRVLAMEPGLGERDYIPLFIAIFVDFCLLLVSVGRPMNGFHWLDERMGQAQEWPVMKILSRFRDIHHDDEIREVFDVFRHVVFDWRGTYYAAVPTNGTDPNVDSRVGRDAAIQAQLLANLFTSFENEKVFVRTPVSFFTTGFVQRKLREQGSRFADAEAFRIYRFRHRMWQDWMLSAMMGAARRVEARKRREELEAERLGVADPRDFATARSGTSEAAPAEGALKTAMRAVESVESRDGDKTAQEAVSTAAATPAANAQDEALASAIEEAVRETLDAQSLAARERAEADAARQLTRRLRAEREAARRVRLAASNVEAVPRAAEVHHLPHAAPDAVRAGAVQNQPPVAQVAASRAEAERAPIEAAAQAPATAMASEAGWSNGDDPMGRAMTMGAVALQLVEAPATSPDEQTRASATPLDRVVDLAPAYTATHDVIALPGVADASGRLANAAVPPAGSPSGPTPAATLVDAPTDAPVTPTFRTAVREALPGHVAPIARDLAQRHASAGPGLATGPDGGDPRAHLSSRLEAIERSRPLVPAPRASGLEHYVALPPLTDGRRAAQPRPVPPAPAAKAVPAVDTITNSGKAPAAGTNRPSSLIGRLGRAILGQKAIEARAPTTEPVAVDTDTDQPVIEATWSVTEPKAVAGDRTPVRGAERPAEKALFEDELLDDGDGAEMRTEAVHLDIENLSSWFAKRGEKR